jgi:hypothetical protein
MTLSSQPSPSHGPVPVDFSTFKLPQPSGYYPTAPANKHPKFDLHIYDDQQLEKILSDPVSSRKTLSDWPLSYVEMVSTAAGESVIYKVQKAPSVEVEFYRSAQSPILPRTELLELSRKQNGLLVELLPGVPASSLSLSEKEAATMARAVADEVRKVSGQVPYYADIGTSSGWDQLTHRMIDTLDRLVAAGTFKLVDDAMIRKLEAAATAPKMLSAMTKDAGLIHADLKGANVICQGASFKVIDWQFPRFGPKDFDVARFIESFGFDPVKEVGPNIVKGMYMVRIEWFADCAQRWIPGGKGFYDKEIARLCSVIENIK